MSDDNGRRPRLSRYNSVMPSSTQIGPAYRGSRVFIPNPAAGRASRNVQSLVPDGYRFVEARPDGVLVERVGGPLPFVGPRVEESERFIAQKQQLEAARQDRLSASQRDLESRFTSPVTTLNGVMVQGGEATPEQTSRINAAADINSIFGPLGIDSQIDPSAQFIFDRGKPVSDVGSGERTSDLHARGILPLTDAIGLVRAKIGGQEIGDTTNMMTVGAVIKWFRGLSVRDRGAYNKLVVMLRNAGYLNGSDEELPLGGYTTGAGVALAQAANDLSQSNDAGDERTMMEYLNDRGKAYSDYLTEQEADRAKEEEYQPVDRRYADPAAIKAAAYDAARAVLGRKLTDEEEERLAARFRGRQDAAYDQIDEAGRAETSFAVEEPDVGGTIDDFLDGDEFQLERKRTLIGDYANEFMRMMGVGG